MKDGRQKPPLHRVIVFLHVFCTFSRKKMEREGEKKLLATMVAVNKKRSDPVSCFFSFCFDSPDYFTQMLVYASVHTYASKN